MKYPLVSLIIINWNGGEVLAGCFRSLQTLNYPNWEIILVDNGSVDGSENHLHAFKLSAKRRVLIKNQKNLGFAPANNQGCKRTKGKYILLLNNDTKITPDFLVKMVERMENDSLVGVLQPKIFLMDKPGYLDNTGSFLTRIGFLEHWGFLKKDSSEFGQEKEIFSAKGACMLIRRDVVNKVGLFDDKFFSYFEESDFCWRVWLAGWRVVFFPRASIHHKVGFTIRRLNVGDLNFHYYKNRITSLIKNLEIFNLLTILSAHLIISIGIALAFFVKLQPKNSFMIVRAILWNLVNMPDILKSRKKVQKLRMVSDGQMFKNLMHPVNWTKYFADFKRVESDIKRKV